MLRYWPVGEKSVADTRELCDFEALEEGSSKRGTGASWAREPGSPPRGGNEG